MSCQAHSSWSILQPLWGKGVRRGFIGFAIPLLTALALTAIESAAARAQSSESFSQCVLKLYRGPYSSSDAAMNCLAGFRGKPTNESLSECVDALYRGPFSSSNAGRYCREAQANSVSDTPRYGDRRRGGNPRAIKTCMNSLLYTRRPVCTRQGSCARLDSPENNADRGFGGWQWQTVSTGMSEYAAASACRNAQ